MQDNPQGSYADWNTQVTCVHPPIELAGAGLVEVRRETLQIDERAVAQGTFVGRAQDHARR